MTPARRAASAGAMVIAALLLFGCGDPSSGSASGGTTTAPAREPLPPTDFAELQAIFEPMIEPLGLTLTRGALIDRSDDGYKVSEDGRHLALYAEPINEEDFTAEVSLATFYDLTALLAPYVFERWSDLETFDVCQEPPVSVDDRPEPFPETQIDLPREAAESFDWAGGDLSELLYLDLTNTEVRTVFGQRTRDAEAYLTPFDAAQQRVIAENTATTG